MTPPPRTRPRAVAAVLAAVLAGAHLSAQAGSLSVRDADGGQWLLVEDPADEAQGYLLTHVAADRKLDPRYGTMGEAALSLGPDNGAPASLRVDSMRRAWAVGPTLAGKQPQPVVLRFTPDGRLDPQWGAQGRVQLAPRGLAVRPVDVLPLSDGTALVSGEAPGPEHPIAVVFHLRADGQLDAAFGEGGVWQRPGDESATAAGLGAAPDGAVAVAVLVRQPKPQVEIWSLNAAPPALVDRRTPGYPPNAGEVRTLWAANHWTTVADDGPSAIVANATLEHRDAIALGAAPSAADNIAQGGFNPFAAAPATSTPATAPKDGDNAVPWGWIGVAVALALGMIAVLFRRSGSGTAPASTSSRR